VQLGEVCVIAMQGHTAAAEEEVQGHIVRASRGCSKPPACSSHTAAHLLAHSAARGEGHGRVGRQPARQRGEANLGTVGGSSLNQGVCSCAQIQDADSRAVRIAPLSPSCKQLHLWARQVRAEQKDAWL